MPSIPELPSEAKIPALIRKVLFPKGLKCCHCLCWNVKKLSTEDRYYCRRCRKKFSLKSSHPLLFRMRISWQEFYALLWFWQQKYQPGQAKQLSGLSHVAVERWFSRFRLYLPAFDEYPPLADMVEVDESQFGHTYHRTDQWVAGAISRTSKQIRLQPIANRDSGCLDKFLIKHIKRDSLVITDAYSAYYGIERFHGFVHEVANHSNGNFGPTAHAENIWSRCDRFIIRVYHQVQKHRLKNILLELQARFSIPELFINPQAYLQFALERVPLS